MISRWCRTWSRPRTYQWRTWSHKDAWRSLLRPRWMLEQTKWSPWLEAICAWGILSRGCSMLSETLYCPQIKKFECSSVHYHRGLVLPSYMSHKFQISSSSHGFHLRSRHECIIDVDWSRNLIKNCLWWMRQCYGLLRSDLRPTKRSKGKWCRV
jgi:hypothetical protein